MATGPIKGKDFKLYVRVNGILEMICYATDCIISYDIEAVEKSNPLIKWRDYLGGKVGYTLSCPGLIAYENAANWLELETLATGRTQFEWEARNNDNGGVVHGGLIRITNLQLTSANRDVMRFNMDAVGCGEKTTDLEPINSSVYLSDFNEVRLPGCPNPYPVSVFWYDETFIGIATNADDVVDIYNSYAGNAYYTLSLGPSGCDFLLQSEWNAPFIPTVVYAQASPDFALSSDQENNMVVSPDQDNDQALSPAYS